MMINFRFKTGAFALAVICFAFAALWSPASFAALNDIACNAIWRGCLDKCGSHGNTQACTDKCDDSRLNCSLGVSNKQQSPPPPCTGIQCTLRNPRPPTTVGQPTRKPSPVQPVRPVGVSNPNKTDGGNNAPVILERKNDSGERGHGR
jgi:hypothetical protein